MEVSCQLHKQFKVMVIKILIKLCRTVGQFSEDFNKEINNVKKNQSELKNVTTEMKSTLEGINSR